MLRTPTIVMLIAGMAPSTLAGPLHDAAREGDAAAVETLLAQGAAIDERAKNGETPLTLAILDGNDAIAALLIDKGAAIEGRNAGGFTPLHAAAYAGEATIAKLLLDRGAIIDDAQNSAGVTPLFPAIEEDHVEVATLLIAAGADLGVKERHGYTALTRALFKGNQDVVVLLRARGAQCQAPDVLGEQHYRDCLDAAK